MKKMNKIETNKQTVQGVVSVAKEKEVYLPPRVEVMSIKMEKGYAGSGTGNGWPGPNRY